MALFEDNYCKVTPAELIIKTFYFPTGRNKNINVKHIRAVYYEEQKFSKHCGKVKGWGMSFSPCWWACDLRRGWHGKEMQYFNVVIDCGEKTYKGFTVNLITTFLEELKKVLHPEAIIYNNFPF